MGLETVMLPPDIRDIARSSGETVTMNGWSADQSVSIGFEGSSSRVFRMKGSLQKGTFLILYDPANKWWYKVAGTPGTNRRISEQEKAGITASLELSHGSHLIPLLKSGEIDVDNYPRVMALRTPHFGPSVEFLARESKGDNSVLNWLYSVYSVAFRHAIALLEEKTIWVEDPNPGNILLRAENQDFASVMIIDYTSKAFKREPTDRNRQLLENRFDKHAAKILLTR
ncbi:hypothetical protein LRY65_01550 [Candidatus Woesebacteria bacterium]|nr:hypothetical protein [Candidatus Woesebacteria bacterium]MCD8507431.1 hypothetical protein [Candidatus Woesebacteria bacterium]MCD8526877.1 hypothetical protein [Candidatus Woesebacteria bacterium]MCD8545785.1 hypothetical protein [Candidatus Woesebacteria bacterium]